jgi:type IV fimbrial biogenesis protein FimT
MGTMNTSDQRTGIMVNKPKPARNGAARASGFTMVELMMTVAIGSIVLMLAVPSFRYVTNSNRIAAEINGLLGDLQFARAEAIKEGRTVTVCVSSDGANCTGGTAWQNGWIVFQDPTNLGVVDANENVLRIQKTFSGTDTFVATGIPNGITSVTFNREGYAAPIANGTILTLHDSTSNTNWTRCLTINLVGQVNTGRVGPMPSGVNCT